MGLDIPFSIVIAYALGLILLYLTGWLLLVPLKNFLKLILRGFLGVIVLWILNILGRSIHMALAVNPITALIVGFLGIPGIILVFILQFLLG